MSIARVVLVGVAIALIVSAAGVYAAQRISGGEGKALLGAIKDEANGPAQNGAGTSVATIPVRVVPQNPVIRLTGTLAGDEKSEVATNTSGIVQKVLVERGSMVEKGQLMVQIDPTDAKNMLAEGLAAVEEIKAALVLGDSDKFNVEEQPSVRAAKAALDLAETNFKRYSGLMEQKAISRAMLD